jgi:hypothetical protein
MGGLLYLVAGVVKEMRCGKMRQAEMKPLLCQISKIWLFSMAAAWKIAISSIYD